MTIMNLSFWIWNYQYEISLVLCTLFLYYIIAMAITKSKKKVPPGPWSLPIVGYWPFLTPFMHKDFIKLGKKYGDIFSVRLGSQDFVIINGGDVIIESVNNPSLLGRSPNFQSGKLRPISIFAGSDFNSWKEHRKFLFHAMKELGTGKSKLEKAIVDEINHFMNFIRRCKAQPVDVKKELFYSITNNTFSLVLRKRFEYDSPVLILIHDKIKEVFEHVVPISLGMAFPWLRYIPLSRKFLQAQKMRAFNKACDIFYREEISQHEETFDYNFKRNLIDLYLIELETKREKHQETTFNHNMLLRLVRDLINASIESVQSSILWILYILAAFPEVQKKVQREILKVIGPEKTPEFMDMKSMPYTHAVLLETMRWKTLIPLSVPHFALNDFYVEGYLIPKDTVVFLNLWAVHHYPRYWVEPEKFIPERFLSSDGKSVVRSKYFMPFSKGGRGCPGESMAILEIFLFCTTILQEFNVVFPDGTKPTFKAKCTLSYRLESYLVQFIPKN